MIRICAIALLVFGMNTYRNCAHGYKPSCESELENWNDLYVGCEKTCDKTTCESPKYMLKYCTCKIGYVRLSGTEKSACVLPEDCDNKNASQRIIHGSTDDHIIVLYVIFLIMAFLFLFICLTFKVLRL